MKLDIRTFCCLVGLVAQGCGPTDRQRTESVQCRNDLKLSYISSLEVLQGATNTVQLSNMLAGLKVAKCPVSGEPYRYNADAETWYGFQSNATAVAIYCSTPHFRIEGKSRLAAIKFDGSFEDLADSPRWPVPTNVGVVANDSNGVRTSPDAGTPRTENHFVPPAAAYSSSLTEILNNRRKFPGYSTLASLVSSDRPLLHRAFIEETNVVDKYSIVVSFRFVGQEEEFQLLKELLLTDYEGRIFSNREESRKPAENMVFFEAVRSIGFIAHQSDSAFEFLKMATEPSFWYKHTKWSSGPNSFIHGRLSSYAIGAIGLTGRPEAFEFVDELRSRNLLVRYTNTVSHLSGPVIDAYYYLRLAKTRGFELLRSEASGGGNVMESFGNWIATSEGQEWQNWAKAKRTEDMQR